MGPIGMLVIQRTLSKGRWPAFFTGIGAAFSDLVYCLLTGFCLSFITGFIEAHRLVIQIVGSAVLAAFGLYLIRKKPKAAPRDFGSAPSDYWSDTVTGFLLTFSNPLILFFIIGLFARFTLIMPEFAVYHYFIAFVSILVGAIAWWYFVTLLVSRLQKRMTVRTLRFINRTIGLLLIIMAAGGIAVAISELLI